MSTGIGIGIAGDTFQTRAGLASGGGGATLLLDLYGADITVAYSVRKLRTAYTGASMRIRRFSDNAEQDIGFDSDGNLDTAAITSFVGSNSAAVVTWYEQSGQASNWNLTQSTTTRQPHITDASGNVFTVNGKPSINDTNSLHRLRFNTNYGQPPSAINQPFHTFQVVRYPSTADRPLLEGSGIILSAYYGGVYRFNAGNNVLTGSNQPNTQVLVDASWNDTSSYLFENNVSQGTSINIGTNSITTLSLMGFNRQLGETQEFLIYDADITTNRADIADNINTYYSIY